MPRENVNPTGNVRLYFKGADEKLQESSFVFNLSDGKFYHYAFPAPHVSRYPVTLCGTYFTKMGTKIVMDGKKTLALQNFETGKALLTSGYDKIDYATAGSDAYKGVGLGAVAEWDDIVSSLCCGHVNNPGGFAGSGKVTVAHAGAGKTPVTPEFVTDLNKVRDKYMTAYHDGAVWTCIDEVEKDLTDILNVVKKDVERLRGPYTKPKFWHGEDRKEESQHEDLLKREKISPVELLKQKDFELLGISAERLGKIKNPFQDNILSSLRKIEEELNSIRSYVTGNGTSETRVSEQAPPNSTERTISNK